MTSPRTAVLAAGLLGALTGPIVAQQAADENSFQRTLERPAHRALVARIARPETELAPFETDGCSGGLSGAWRLVADQFPQFATSYEAIPPWEACCVTHDHAYHDAGGATEADESYAARLNADRALEACVRQTSIDRSDDLAALYEATPEQVTSAYETIAGAMFLAVRFGGAPCSGLPWRWGYGYPGCSILTDRDD